MNWYFEVFRRFADYSGRSRRKEFWYFILFNFIILFSLIFSQDYLNTNDTMDKIINTISGIYFFILIIPLFGVIIRRLHDSGRSALFILIYFIPFVGAISLIVVLCLDSENGPNKYGENPKGIGNKKDEFEEINQHLVE